MAANVIMLTWRKGKLKKKHKGEKRKPKEEEMVHLKKKDTRNFNLIIKYNSHRKRSKDKEAEVEHLKTEIVEKERVDPTNVNVMKK